MPLKMQLIGGIWWDRWGFPPTITIGRQEGEVGSQNFLRIKYVVSVFKRKEVECSNTMMSTRSSLSEKTVVKYREPRHPSSVIHGQETGGLCLMFPCHHMYREVHCPVLLLIALWALSTWPTGIRAKPAQCPSWPHLKQGPGSSQVLG